MNTLGLLQINSIQLRFWDFLYMYFCFNSAKSADPNERLSDVAFHLVLHCLLNYMYLFTGFQNEKG